MKFIPFLLMAIVSCSTKQPLKYEDGWHKAYVETMGKNNIGAMVLTTNDAVDSICFNDTCIGHFTQWTLFEHSQNVSGKSNEIYTVYIIPDEWDQTKELFENKPDKDESD